MLAETLLSPDALLSVGKRIEQLAGRRRTRRWGPRPLDVDLLIYGDLVVATPELTLPHPELRRRAFVLKPLHDLAPQLPVPPDGRTVTELLAELPASALAELRPLNA